MVYDLLLTVISGLITVLAAVFMQYISRRQKESANKSKEEISHIADLVKTEESKTRAASVEKLLEKIPSGLQIDEFSRKIEEAALRLTQTIPAKPEDFDAVENLINGYHEQALEQAKVQFWFSVAAATVGFALIIYQGANIDINNISTTMKILPGTVMDAVAFLFFKQATETRQRATELYDRLRTDKRNTQSVNLVASIEDIKVRSAVKAQIALHMSGLNPSPIDLTNFLSSQNIKVACKEQNEESKVTKSYNKTNSDDAKSRAAD